MQIWAESGKSALPICNYSQILYQFLTFTQNLKRSLVIYANDSDPFIINCQKCNSSVILDNPDDIVYLYRLAQDAPLLYAELALKADGLQGYVEAMNEFN